MNRCKRCLIPDTRPDTAFVDGTCSACIAYDQRPQIDWQFREQQLIELLKIHDWRCVVPSSGGKDSHWQTLKLIELGAKPVCVTATTCHLTPYGRANIDNLARYAPTVEVTPNMTARRKLNRAGLELVGDISWPEHASIFTVPFRIAYQLGIPLIFYGECPQNQYGGPLETQSAMKMDGRWVSEFGGFLGLRATDLIGREGLTKDDMAHYQIPKPEVLDNVEAYFLGQFLPWDSERNAEIAHANGMVMERPSAANWWPYENLDNAQTGLHDALCYRKYGYGRLCAQISVDIRRGAISREDAYPIVQARDGAFPTSYAGVPLGQILERLGMSVSYLLALLDRFTNQDLFDRVEEARPILKEFA